MASGFVTYYSINALFATHLQKDVGLSSALVATPIALGNLSVFAASGSWGWVSDRIGRRWAMIIPALLAIPVAPLYLMTHNIVWIAIGFMVQGACGGDGMQGQMPTYLSERFPTEVRATASGFCFHQGAIWGGLVPLVLTFFAVHYDLGHPLGFCHQAKFVRHRDRFEQTDERGDIWRRDPRYAIRSCCHHRDTKVTTLFAAAQAYPATAC